MLSYNSHERRYAICATCDAWCLTAVSVRGEEVRAVRALDPRPLHADICIKGVHAPQAFAHSRRLLHPLRRVGERGSGRWEPVGWAEAMDDITGRLRDLVDEHGPETLAVSSSPWNITADNGASRRFMNLLGSPNWISPVALCAGNTAAVNRMVYGWFPYPDTENARCVVLFGHNPKKHSWTPVYNAVRRAQRDGAKLIVLDPRRSENADVADLWLPLRPGTDAAMCFGWLKVIIDECLYDREFVDRWTIGFDELRRRVDEYPLGRVAAITGVDSELIRAAARMYAAARPGVIPWTPITDQQRNSTSAIRLICSLRALTGNLDVQGGERLHGFNPDVVSESELELHELLPQGQKDKQLGADEHPVFTYRGMEALREPTRRSWGTEWANLLSGCYMANPSATFRAMADSEPYPVRAFFSLGNNTLMSYANMQLVYRALMNQDLLVVHEHIMSPTAQLADYVLPGDSWLERPALLDGMGWTASYRASQQAVDPPGECRSVYDFWRELALRMGFGEYFPWATLDELLNWRLETTGLTFEELGARAAAYAPAPVYRKYESTGFATPSGKVELASSVLAGLGFDPLPYYREDPPPDPRFPLCLIMGVREDEYFQTGGRHVEQLRRRRPEPEMMINAREAARLGLATGDWVYVEVSHGRIKLRVSITDRMPDGVVRAPHGWWKPEMPQGKDALSGAWEYADGLLCSDAPDFLDREQGIPHFKGVPCRVIKTTAPHADAANQTVSARSATL